MYAVGIIYAVSTCVCFYFFQDYITQNNITLVQSVNSKIRFPQTSDLIGSTILFILIVWEQDYIVQKKQ